MISFSILCTIFIVVTLVDTICYAKAKYPERIKWYYRIIPGGGIAALLILGKGDLDNEA